jgi:hypothetical protein
VVPRFKGKDNRRVSNGDQVQRLARLAMKPNHSVDFTATGSDTFQTAKPPNEAASPNGCLSESNHYYKHRRTARAADYDFDPLRWSIGAIKFYLGDRVGSAILDED